MAEVTVFTAARMQAIEDSSIVSGLVVGDDLVLYRRDESPINAGNIRGPIGPQGVPGEVTQDALNAAVALLQQEISNAHGNGAISRSQLANDIIDNTKIADNAVRAEHLNANSVGASEIVANAVGASEIATGAVTLEKINSSVGLSGAPTVSNALNGWGGEVRYKKVGNLVFYSFYSNAVNNTSGTIFIFPSGFRPNGYAARTTGVDGQSASTYEARSVTINTSGTMSSSATTSRFAVEGFFFT